MERFPPIPDLAAVLARLISQTPAGRVTTCGDLAEALGDRIAARWVGHYTLHHEHDAQCACHRILRAGGLLGPYITGDINVKANQLIAEGVEIHGGVVDLERFGFREFRTDRPLEGLRRAQEAIRPRIVIRPRRRIPRFVGGVDVAYPKPEVGSAAYALVETATGRLVWSTTVRRRVPFPYITTYLSFREIPILLELLDAVRAAGKLAPVVLVDGTGILHHRRAGIASHLGVAASLATIGVTKKLLCGRGVEEGNMGRAHQGGQSHFRRTKIGTVPSRMKIGTVPIPPGLSRPVMLDDRPAGVAIRPTPGSRRPIFVSPGHRADVAFADELVRRLLFGRRLPEPLYWADRLSRERVL